MDSYTKQFCINVRALWRSCKANTKRRTLDSWATQAFITERWSTSQIATFNVSLSTNR